MSNNLDNLSLEALKQLHLDRMGTEFAAAEGQSVRSQILAALGEPRGLGDTVARFTQATGLDRLAQAYTHLTGRPCNCGERQAALNKLFPYKSK